jgi:hypothetical protein
MNKLYFPGLLLASLSVVTLSLPSSANSVSTEDHKRLLTENQNGNPSSNIIVSGQASSFIHNLSNVVSQRSGELDNETNYLEKPDEYVVVPYPNQPGPKIIRPEFDTKNNNGYSREVWLLTLHSEPSTEKAFYSDVVRVSYGKSGNTITSCDNTCSGYAFKTQGPLIKVSANISKKNIDGVEIESARSDSGDFVFGKLFDSKNNIGFYFVMEKMISSNSRLKSNSIKNQRFSGLSSQLQNRLPIDFKSPRGNGLLLSYNVSQLASDLGNFKNSVVSWANKIAEAAVQRAVSEKDLAKKAAEESKKLRNLGQSTEDTYKQGGGDRAGIGSALNTLDQAESLKNPIADLFSSAISKLNNAVSSLFVSNSASGSQAVDGLNGSGANGSGLNGSGANGSGSNDNRHEGTDFGGSYYDGCDKDNLCGPLRTGR